MTVKEIADKLRATELFRDLDGLEELAEKYPPVRIKLFSGERYEIKNSLAIFLDGKADIIKESGSKTAFMKSVSELTLLGLATLFSKEEEYISTLVSKTETTILLFSEDFVRALVSCNSEFSIRLIGLLCQKVRYLNSRIDFYTCSDAEEKLREYLVRSSDNDGTVNMSMSKLSETLNIGRASLYRAITALEEKGYIIKNGKTIQLIK